jgi:hypothetical protein
MEVSVMSEEMDEDFVRLDEDFVLLPESGTRMLDALRTENCVCIWGWDEDGFLLTNGPAPDEFWELAEAHADRLRAILDKPALIDVGWALGDDEAVVRVLPIEGWRCKKPDYFAFNRFRTDLICRFKLPFPKKSSSDTPTWPSVAAMTSDWGDQ